MRSSVLQEIISRIDSIQGDALTKTKVKQLVRAIGFQHGVKSVQRNDRLDFVAGLREKRVSRPTIAARLSARYGISRPQAYRDIQESINLYQKSPLFETAKPDNEHTT